MKLEVGMYVRTKKSICKIDRKVDDITNYYFGCFKCDNYINCNGDEFISEWEILKASHNIIDLIEVGDYVNGSEVLKIGIDNYDDNATYKKYLRCVGNSYFNEQIKSIVTKEQFESMSYKL